MDRARLAAIVARVDELVGRAVGIAGAGHLDHLVRDYDVKLSAGRSTSEIPYPYVLDAGQLELGGISLENLRVSTGASEMTTAFRASGLHIAMYVMPVLVLLCAGSLFGAASTVAKDMRRRDEEPAGASVSRA